jgi:predicted O-methyltransferase YrrM
MNILELGTFEGRTTRALAEVMPTHARIWTVDHERRHQGFEDDPRIVFVQQDALEFLTSAPTGCFNFVFIDDSHEYAHVAQEIDMLLDRLVWRPALITGHDVEGAFGLGPLYVDRGGFIIELPLLHAGGSLGVIECP